MKAKRLLSLLLAGVMTSTLLAGCGGDDSAPTDGSSANGSASSAAADSDLAYVKGNGVLKIGYTVYEPMNYTDEAGTFTGFDTEFAQAVCEKLGVEPQFVEIEWGNKVMELDSKNVDCLWNGFTITEDMKQSLDFTDPYVQNKQVLVVKEENKDKYKDTAALKGKSVAVEAGSAGQSVAEADENLKDGIWTVAKQTDALLELKAGSVEAAVFDNTLAQNMIGEGTDFADLTIATTLMEEQYGVGFRKGSDLCAEVNSIMNDMKADGSLQTLVDKYGLELAE